MTKLHTPDLIGATAPGLAVTSAGFRALRRPQPAGCPLDLLATADPWRRDPGTAQLHGAQDGVHAEPAKRLSRKAGCRGTSYRPGKEDRIEDDCEDQCVEQEGRKVPNQRRGHVEQNDQRQAEREEESRKVAPGVDVVPGEPPDRTPVPCGQRALLTSPHRLPPRVKLGTARSRSPRRTFDERDAPRGLGFAALAGRPALAAARLGCLGRRRHRTGLI